MKNKMRSAFTMVDLMVTIIVVGLFIWAAIAGYNKVYLPSVASAEVKKTKFVIGGIENDRTRSNAGAYRASATTSFSAQANLRDALGGALAVRDIGGWTYQCTAGANSTITIMSEDYNNATVRNLIASRVSSQFAPWVAAVSGTKIRFTRANSNCQ